MINFVIFLMLTILVIMSVILSYKLSQIAELEDSLDEMISLNQELRSELDRYNLKIDKIYKKCINLSDTKEQEKQYVSLCDELHDLHNEFTKNNYGRN